MKDGLTANFYNVKNLVQGTTTDFDSALVVNLTAKDDSVLFNYLKADSKTDTVSIDVPCYTRYGILAKDRFCRVRESEGFTEVWLPDVTLFYSEMKFDKMLLNGKPATALMNSANGVAIRNKMYSYFIPRFEKNKARKKITKDNAVTSLMFYFIPYGIKLKMFIDNELYPLPLVPGLNKDAQEAMREFIGK